MATWIPDLKWEHKLASRGVPFVRALDFLISRVDLELSKARQSRLDANRLDEAYADEISAAMKCGVPFLQIVIALDPRTHRYYVVDGLHRLLGAIKAGERVVEAILITSEDSRVLELAVRTANVHHGRPQGEQSLEANAVQLQNQRYGDAEIAAWMELPLEEIAVLSRAEETRRELARAGVDTARLSRTAILRLHALREPVVQAAAAHLVVRANLPVDQVRWLVAEVNKRATFVDQLGFIEQVAHSNPDVQRRLRRQEKVVKGTFRRPPVDIIVHQLTVAKQSVERHRDYLETLMPRDYQAVVEAARSLGQNLEEISRARAASEVAQTGRVDGALGSLVALA